MDPQMTEFAWSLSLRLPLILVSLGGIVWAIVNWGKASTPAMFAAIACVVLLMSSCLFPALLVWLPRMMQQNVDTIRWTVRAILGSWSLCTAVGVGALVFAVFAGRSAPRPSQESARKPVSFDEDDDDSTVVDDRIKSS